jgi:beta-lactamase class A
MGRSWLRPEDDVRRTTLPLLFATLALPASSGLSAREPRTAVLRDEFQTRLGAVIQEYEGVAGFHILDLTEGSVFAFRDDRVFPQASAIKVPILPELFRRAQDEPELLQQRVEVTESNRTGGSDVLRYLTDGFSALSLEDHAVYMILYSVNTAPDVLVDAPGMDAVNRLSASLGARDTRLQRRMIRPEASARGREILVLPKGGPYGGDGGAVSREISALAWDHFSRLAGVPHPGTRVPLEIKRRVCCAGSGE